MLPKQKRWPLRAAFLGGLIGWPSGFCSLIWIGHQSPGGSTPWEGRVLIGLTLLALVTAIVGLLGIVYAAKKGEQPVQGRQWIAVAFGISFVAPFTLFLSRPLLSLVH